MSLGCQKKMYGGNINSDLLCSSLIMRNQGIKTGLSLTTPHTLQTEILWPGHSIRSKTFAISRKKRN